MQLQSLCWGSDHETSTSNLIVRGPMTIPGISCFNYSKQFDGQEGCFYTFTRSSSLLVVPQITFKQFKLFIGTCPFTRLKGGKKKPFYFLLVSSCHCRHSKESVFTIRINRKTSPCRYSWTHSGQILNIPLII